jgi:hypothetical protein
VRHHVRHHVRRHMYYNNGVSIRYYSGPSYGYDSYGGGVIYRQEGRRYEYDEPCGPIVVVPSGSSVYYYPY